MRKLNVAIVGTGAVGQALLTVLAERQFPVGQLKLLATERSAGKRACFQGQEYTIAATTPDAFAGVDLALFAGGGASLQYAREAVARGAVVIDNASSFRLDPDVPLVVPEVNPEDLAWHRGIIANPNCSTIQMVVALKPIHEVAGLKRVIVSTYQAVSGAGQEAMDELWGQTQQVLAGETVKPRVFAHQIAFNVIPHIDVFEDSGYTKEEMKMVNETRKMMHLPDLPISATTVRVPVLRSHSEAINVELEQDLSPEAAREILAGAPGVVVMDDTANNIYPMPWECSDKDEVFIGRIRRDASARHGLCLWVVADQLRKGAATNAVQIAELLVKKDLLR